jgi:tetratricopeptide (TPR) repeat protein
MESVLLRFNLLTKRPLKKRALEDETCIKHQHAFDATLSQSQKAYYHFLRGKLLAVLEKYSPASEVDLQKSVKLDPMNTFAWNALGEVYWKKGVLENSKRCFAMGLKMERNVQGLGFHATYLRSAKSKDKIQSAKNIQESINLCREATDSDPNDFKAWYGLGTSYMKLFFDLTRDTGHLEQSLKAYNHAETCLTNIDKPDLHLNRAIIHHYLEAFPEAFKDYEKGALLDPLSASLEKKSLLLNYLNRFNLALHDMKKSSGDWGCDELVEGVNKSCSVKVKLLKEIYNEFGLPRTFVAMDTKENKAIGVTVYNVSPTIVKLGDVLTINSPELIVLDINAVKFKSIRSEVPTNLLVNGKKLSLNDIAYSTMTIES